MRYILFTFCCFFLTIISAQDVYPLHPSVGDTIDVDEKLDYSLFPKIDNDGFQYATIQFKGEKFVLIVNSIDLIDKEVGLEAETVSDIDLSQEEIIEEQQKIQKVNAYYKYLAEEASKPKKSVVSAPGKAVPIRLEGAMSEKMKKEARMNVRLKEDNRRLQEFEMGLRPNPRELRIEFK